MISLRDIDNYSYYTPAAAAGSIENEFYSHSVSVRVLLPPWAQFVCLSAIGAISAGCHLV
ncbi:Hypothetical protein ETEE_3471 [Edwardsiella anguillarum ET080813]|uniref:Uncharacterized protein n=1 Tax=Edwardsiella anguillarum ET080813 TaxID=667120 RepID=A0A076LTU0_9GAMM|nr:Hypothetical protein ETEE_3471 [Edwardsiella anguillarum ET080813]